MFYISLGSLGGSFTVGVDVINYFPQTPQLAPYLGVGAEALLDAQDCGVYGLGGSSTS